jgi:predicted Zn-dependent protease
VREMYPNFPRSGLIASAYAHIGSFEKAFAEMSPAVDTVWSWTTRAELYGLAGRRDDAQNALNGLLQLQQRQPPHQSVNMACVAVAYLSVENKEQALAWLERAYQEQPNTLTSLKVDPIYDPLRSDPRFQELLRRVGLAK